MFGLTFRDSNPGPVFSILGFGIGECLIQGFRRDYGMPVVSDHSKTVTIVYTGLYIAKFAVLSRRHRPMHLRLGLGLALWLGLQLGIGIGFRRNHSWSSTFTPRRNHSLCLEKMGRDPGIGIPGLESLLTFLSKIFPGMNGSAIMPLHNATTSFRVK